MIAENSGKIYRFKLDHHFGFGFAEIYDFTDEASTLDGCIVYVYDRHDKEEQTNYQLSEIRKLGTALGPIRMCKFPAARGLHSWKYLFQTDKLLILELPETKELHGIRMDNNWNNLKGWYSSKQDIKEQRTYLPYEKVRYLETRIINVPSGVVREFTMKVILDSNENVGEYYDLSNLANRNIFVYLVNTYYPLKKAKQLLKHLPMESD